MQAQSYTNETFLNRSLHLITVTSHLVIAQICKTSWVDSHRISKRKIKDVEK